MNSGLIDCQKEIEVRVAKVFAK